MKEKLAENRGWQVEIVPFSGGGVDDYPDVIDIFFYRKWSTVTYGDTVDTYVTNSIFNTDDYKLYFFFLRIDNTTDSSNHIWANLVYRKIFGIFTQNFNLRMIWK